MLILMRRPGESICIGGDIIITVLAVERHRVRVGVEAPRDVSVDRKEIAERKRLGIAPPLKDAPVSSG